MVKNNIFIDVFRLEDIIGNSSVHLINCIVDTVNFTGAFELNSYLRIENCIINSFLIHSCWFNNGLLLKNCIIKNYVDYQMGGHNAEPILIEGNIFNDFVNFFDCQFEEVIEIKNNIFVKGSNLLGNKGEGFENTFDDGWIVKQNMGNIDLDGVGM